MKNLSQIIKTQSQSNPKFAQCSLKLKRLLQKCQSQSKFDPVLVTDKIFVGNISAASNASFIERNNIKLIISCLQIQPTHKFNNLIYHQVPVKDRQNEPISEYFQKVWNWIQNEDGNILIHCWGGKSRSVAVALSYMLRKHAHQWSFQQIYQQMKIRYPLSKINSYFQNQLKRYFQTVKKNLQQDKRFKQNKEEILNKSQNLAQNIQINSIQTTQDLLGSQQTTIKNTTNIIDNYHSENDKNNFSLIDLSQAKKQQLSLLEEEAKYQKQSLIDLQEVIPTDMQINVNLLDLNQKQNSLSQIKQCSNNKDLIDFQQKNEVTMVNFTPQIQKLQINQQLQKTQQNRDNLLNYQTFNGQEKQQTELQLKQQNQQQLCGSGQPRKKKKKKKNKK